MGCKHCFSHFLVFSCWSCMLTHWILLAPGFDQPPWHVNHQCQTAIFHVRSSKKASENVSFEIYQVGSLDCESIFYCLINLDQFVSCYSSGTTIIELYWWLLICTESFGSEEALLHYSSALYARALPRTLTGHKLTSSSLLPSLLRSDKSLCISWHMSSFYVHLLL